MVRDTISKKREDLSTMCCPICNGREYWSISFVRDPGIERSIFPPDRPADYGWRLCRRCGNAYPSRPPTLHALQKLWDENRTDAGSTARESAERWSYRRAIAKAGAERSYRMFAPLARSSNRRFLDIACGLGETVSLFAARGWDAEGVDADPSAEPIHRELGIRARICQFEEVELETGYDIIHIAHAIYFITDPMGFMRNVRDRLARNGLFCVVLADFLANEDQGLPSYPHTFFPTRSSMRYALALAGFNTIWSKVVSGSIYIAACPAAAPIIPRVYPNLIRLGYETKALRFGLIGRPYLALRQLAKAALGRG